jgi:hypothetical protein
VENIRSSFACSPAVLSGAVLGAHLSTRTPGMWAASDLGLGMTGGLVVAPVTTDQGTRVSSALRNRTAAPAKVTALLPISDVVVSDGFAGIRTWSPPV